MRIPWNKIIFLGVAISMIGYATLFWSELKKSARDDQFWQVYTAGLPYRGDGNADIRILEFIDLNCPYCKRAHHNIHQEILQPYVEQGKAVVYYMDVGILGKDSELGRGYVTCLHNKSNTLAVQFIDHIYTSDARRNGEVQYQQALDTLAPHLKDSMKRCAVSDGIEESASNQEIYNTWEVNGVPTFLIGDQLFPADPDMLRRLMQDLSEDGSKLPAWVREPEPS